MLAVTTAVTVILESQILTGLAMAKGSQLSQLKSALSQAGVTKNSSGDKKRKRSAVPLEREKEKRAARLEEIHRRLNPFDVKVTKTKHDVGGRKIKGIIGKPAHSKQAGIERRKKTLLKEWEERNRSGGIVDRRFGENDPTMSLEERMLERFTRERQRTSKGVAFNLEDEDELTHYGQSLSKLDDFDNVGLGLESDDEAGQLDKQVVSQTHFGGFDEEEEKGSDDENDEPARKKSKAEVMAEVIAKSKEHKILRQIEKEQEENIRHELDNDFAALRDLLYAPDPSLKATDTTPLDKLRRLDDKPSDATILPPGAQDAGYDHHVRELAFDKRSKPKDRTKTEEELALEEKEALEKAEKQRRKRMLGLEDSENEDEGKTRRKRKRGGDDLEDDFFDDEGHDWAGLGAGLEAGMGADAEEDEVEEDKSDDEGEESSAGEEDEEDYETSEGGSEDEDGEQEDLTAVVANGKGKASSSTYQELPFTFPAPGSHEEFLEIIENVKDGDVPLVIQRIRALYHTSLAPENKLRLQASTLANVLIDHILYVTAPPEPRFSLVSSLLPHLLAVVKAYPISVAQSFNEKLSLMHKNLKRGLSRGATVLEARTWPGPSELSLLRVIGIIWPTSDLNHAVISPARYESLSKRFVPEVVNFLLNAFLHLSPTKFKEIASLPGSFPAPDFLSESSRQLRLQIKKSTLKPSKTSLRDLLMLEEPREQAKVDLLALTLDLLGRFADVYKGLNGFVELYEPVLGILQGGETRNWCEELKSRYAKVVDMVTRLLHFGQQAHQPLTLQAHKPIPIPSYIPKFDNTTSNYLRKKDPDHEKNEAAKLRYQLKQEKKGAIRELRKDARFLASVEQKRQMEKDRDYNERLRKAFTSIESERAEQKAMEREKAREKRRNSGTPWGLEQERMPCRRARDSRDHKLLPTLPAHGFGMTTDIPSATPFPIPTFNGSESDASLDQFLDFLRALISQYLSDNAPRIPSSNKVAWITVISGLTDHLLSTFPLPNLVSWTALREKVISVNTTLDVVKRVFERVDGIHQGTTETIKKVFARLLHLCFVLDSWLDNAIKPEDEQVHPEALRERCFEALVVVLRGLGENVSTSREHGEPSWKTLRTASVVNVIERRQQLTLDIELTSKSMHLNYPLTLSLFGDPRILGGKPNDLFEADSSNPFELVVPSAAHVPTCLSTLLQVLARVTTPSLLCRWFLADLVKRVPETMKNVLDLTLSPIPFFPSARRARICGDILLCSLHLQQSPDLAIQSAYFPCFLVRCRLYDGPKDAWDLFDQTTAQMLQDKPIYGISRVEMLDVMKSLCAESWGVRGSKLRDLGYTFTRGALAGSKDWDADILLHDISSLKEMPQYHTIIQLVRGVPTRSAPELNHSHTDDLRVVLENLGHKPMDYDDRSLHDPSETARLELARNLAKLPCLVTRCNKSNCRTHESSSTILFSQLYNPIVALLLDGPEGEVTPAVRRQTFRALKCAIDHHPIGNSISGLDDAEKLLVGHIKDVDRGARLAACHGLVALISAYTHAVPNPWHLTRRIFAPLYHHMGHAKENMKETVLVAVGLMGKTEHPDVLGQVLCFLIAQLGQPNPVVKGMASIQLSELTRFHNKTPYTLVLPYLDHVAQFLISKISASPTLLSEACKFLSIAPGNFISVTAPRTFPQIFSRCDAKAVDAVARQMGQKASTLFLQHSPAILAKILMLPKPEEGKATIFVLKILADASQSETIDLHIIVRLSLVKLLGELVIFMGDENPETVKEAINAITKIERIVGSTSNNSNQSTVDLSTFLKAHMLGLISQVNDMLQDVQGKKTVAIKRKIIRGLGVLVLQIGPTITYVAPQIMATFQTMIGIPELSEATLQSWYKFLTTLGPAEVGPHVGPTSAAFVGAWGSFSPKAKQIAVESMEYIVQEVGKSLGQYLDDIVDISSIPEFSQIRDQLNALRSDWSPQERLQRLLDRSTNENISVAIQSLDELKSFLRTESGGFVKTLVSGDMFDPIVGQVISTLLAAACRDGDGMELLRVLAYECIGILGAVDPDRCELPVGPPRIIVKNNFADEDETMQFALHLICDLLVGAFRSSSDIKHQSFLAYTIQELLKFCHFKPALVGIGTGASIPNRVRNRWKSLPKHVLETVTPLLEGKFTLNLGPNPSIKHPIYSHQSTYREWIQLWTAYLIDQASGCTAQSIFNIFRSAVRNKDAGVAHHLLPHLVLNILIGGNEEDAHRMRAELLVVLQDQINHDSDSLPDKKLLSAQAVFMLLDHLNAWVRVVRQELNAKKVDSKRVRGDRSLLNTQLEEQLIHVDSILSSIDHHLMAQAAFQCKAFARSLMHFEQQIMVLKESPQNRDLSGYYERLHEIYAHLDEPDGMEGISTLILSPSLEHQIRQHESTGHWTSAQSCWEVRLQQSPDNVEFHLGLLRCLRNLGHYDTLRTHVRGVLTRKPEWRNALAGLQIESAWMVGAWDDVQNFVEQSTVQTAQVVTGQVLLAMRKPDWSAISTALSNARAVLGSPITAAGPRSYRRSYDAVLDLHLIHELELIHQTATRLPESSQGRSQERRHIMNELTRILDTRLESILPTFRFRELVLSMRRTAFSLLISLRHNLVTEIGKTWLASAKIARKAGQWQTAYSAMLQAQQSETQFAFLESAKLVKATGDPLRALKDLENSMKLAGHLEASDFLDLTIEDEAVRMKSKAQVLRARWMRESQRYDPSSVYKIFQQVTEMDKNSEKAHFYLGQFHDEIFKTLSSEEKLTRGLKMILATVRAFLRAVKQGSKYLYQTVPRLLTLWLDIGESTSSEREYREAAAKCQEHASRAIREIPAYKWYIAFPQIVSRVGHRNPETFQILSRLILKVLEEYPKQALWIFSSVVKSTKSHREQRGRAILDQLKNNPKLSRTKIPILVQQIGTMTNELLSLCDHQIDDDKKTLHMRKDFPRLAQIGRCELIIPLQESLTASLPPVSADQSAHQPFPANLPMFHEFFDEIDIMRSLAKPRKISIRGTDGQTYTFLGKPKDDLRKDARLMEFNSIINKLLKANSESRKRQLHIRTYGVVTLNEECGFIQWVPNTIPVRPVLVKNYDARRIKSWSPDMGEVFRKIKDADDQTAAGLFIKHILPKYDGVYLCRFPPVFHEWFLETFPEPSAWLASRMTYGRTAAVMSMILNLMLATATDFGNSLGDRHCENILLDINTGDVVHVDFNCLFEKGKGLETPERVPFRLTQNLVDGLGITGVEVTLQLLRDNKDSLMNVLDSFIHDPLVEWEDEKRRLDRQRNQVKTSIDSLAKTALSKIEKKLKGIYIPDTSKDRNVMQEKEVTTGNLVQVLIQEATDDANLVRSYLNS
ncbi:hypothetical protein D9756_000300 [Leucocoprinus leucothites]|uniref:non-specific serine/threonine protein kinase n=1 Tax=Leucocoprinus leucothites TaxID=201217 RepID=A0A8H5LNF9_9AGAR|nr:hypothetical protein D9756_000300 [Leucoagaricus leucothites]